MRRKSFEDMECGIAQALERIGDLWAFLILRDALFGIQTFDGFYKSLGIPKNTLATRLNDMVESGLLSRSSDPNDGRRTVYRLEKAGEELWVVLVALSQWGNKWVYAAAGPPSYVADRAAQKPLAEVELRTRDGKKPTLNEITMILGPSGSASLGKRFEAIQMAEHDKFSRDT